jgi:hypothetical protein
VLGRAAGVEGSDAGASCIAEGVAASNAISPLARGLDGINSSLATFSPASDDAALSGRGDTAAGASDVDACSAVKPAIADEGTWDTASSVELALESTRSGAPDSGAAASAVDEGVTVARDMDPCGIAKPATTDAGASETGWLFEALFGSNDWAASEGNAASSGFGDGAGLGTDVAAAGVAKAAKTDAGASPFESGFEPSDSMANDDDVAASAAGDGMASGTDIGA